MKQYNKISFSTILIEVISIIIAVIMGFLVNEWRETQNNKLKAESALNRITNEIEKNHSQLKEKQKYYKKMISVLDSLILIYRNGTFKSKSIPDWNGLNPPLLSSSSFNTASTIGVFSFVDFDTADKISKVYLLQDFLQQLGTITINSIISGDLQNYKSVRLVFELYSELIESLMNVNDQILKQNLNNYRSKLDTN